MLEDDNLNDNKNNNDITHENRSSSSMESKLNGQGVYEEANKTALLCAAEETYGRR